MDIKAFIIKNDKTTFETELKKYIKNGYQIKASDIKILRNYTTILGKPMQLEEPDCYYYALLQKE